MHFDNLIDKLLGRILISNHKTTTGNLSIINVYVPCGYEDDLDNTRYQAKLDFLAILKDYIHFLMESGNMVILVGDLNVKLHVTDSADAVENSTDSIFVEKWLKTKDKAIFREILNLGMVDCFRHLHPNLRHIYTCWNSGLRARINNYGTRIDYILVSKNIDNNILSFKTLTEIEGSDHCPILAELDIELIPSKNIPSECTLFYPELTGVQTTLRDLVQTSKPQILSKNSSITSNAPPVKRKISFNGKRKPLKQVKLNFAAKSDHEEKPDNKTELPQKSYTSHIQHPSHMKRGAPSLLSALSGLPKPPCCTGHNLKATLKTVSKQGPNFGRRFYCCQLSIGPSHLDSSRCNFFLWFDDHKKKAKN